ncbi:hypothetical protein JTB14_003388 [Gonioctena quinquepunctata]|nr:hypothetical protein JTB14_003388 [Gonioctena quinquepunctata]
MMRSNHSLVVEDPRHKSIDFMVNCSPVKSRISNVTLVHSFRKANYEAINGELEKIAWAELFQSNSLDNCIDIFYEQIYSIIGNLVPKKKIDGSFPLYFTNSTIKLIKDENRAHKKWKNTLCINDYIIFSELRRKTKRATQTDYDKYIKSIENELPKSSNKIWLDNEIAEGGNVAGLFAKYFSSVYQPYEQKFVSQAVRAGDEDCISKLRVTEDQSVPPEDSNEFFINIAESIINTIPCSYLPDHLHEPLNMANEVHLNIFEPVTADEVPIRRGE